jgi:hypothetical protein
MSFGTATNGAVSDTDPFNGFRPPYKIAQKVTFPNITGRDAPGKTGSAAKPALVSGIALRVSGYGGDTATTRYGLFSSTGTSPNYSDLFTLPTNDTPPLTSRNLTTSRTVFSSVEYYVGFTKTSTARYTWGVDLGFTDAIKQDNTNSGATSNFKDDGLISPGGSNGSLIYQLLYDVLPTAPTSLAGSVSSNDISLTWGTVSSTGGQAITGYRIQRSDNDSTWTTIVENTASTATTYTDTGLTFAQTYYYRVAAINAVATSAGADYSGPYTASISQAVPNAGAASRPSRVTATVANPEPSALVFTDSGPGITFSAINVQYGSEYLFTEIEASTQDSFAVIQTASAPGSTQIYGLRSLSVSGLLNSTDAGALEVARDLLTYYYEPELRVESILVNLMRLTPEDKQKVLQLDIDSYISVTFTPNQIGDPKITSGLVTGISHNITPTTHEVELNLRTERNLFTLNSESKGILDEDILGP